VKPIKHQSRGVVLVECVLLALLAGDIVGCTPIEWPHFGSGWGGNSSGLKVRAVSNRDVAALSSDDIVQIMRRSGFSDEQILELGTEVRNALLQSGAAEIRKGKVEVLFAVRGEYVFIDTRSRGSFIYDIKRGRFGVVHPSEKSS
jgi:hypothetical protein